MKLMFHCLNILSAVLSLCVAWYSILMTLLTDHLSSGGVVKVVALKSPNLPLIEGPGFEPSYQPLLSMWESW